MRLFTKIALTLAGTAIAGTIASALAVALVFVPQYQAMDRDAAAVNASRVFEALQGRVNVTASFTRDWSHWDEAFNFVKSLSGKIDREFISRNLKQADIEEIGADQFLITDWGGKILFSRMADQSASARSSPFAGLTSIPEENWKTLDRNDLMTTHSGIALTREGPVVLSAKPITDSNNNGPATGILVLMKFVDNPFLEAVHNQTKLPFTLLPLHAQAHNYAKTDGLLDADLPVKDLAGRTRHTLHTTTPAHFAALARTTLWMVVGILVVIAIIVVVILSVFIRRVVTQPLETLTRHAQSITRTGDLSQTLALPRSDEIGALSQAYDEMISQLRQARAELQEVSFASGMANVAADILHNIRNSLSPVTTALWKGRECLNDLRTARLTEAGIALSDAALEPERKAKLASFVTQSAKHIEARSRSVIAEFATIHDLVNQMENVLSHHEDISRGIRYVERVSIYEVLRASAALAGTVELNIATGIETLPPVTCQRVVLRQIIDNLILNAVQSVERQKPERGTITVDARASVDTLILTISDNGQGIEADHLPNLFTRGYTSRKGAGKGFGLHYCATSLQAMNGKVSARSEGLGLGAAFTLILPLANAAEVAA